MTPWGTMMRTAAALGVGPEGFWRLSLAEWQMLTGGAVGPEPMARVELERLAKAWPDEEAAGGGDR